MLTNDKQHLLLMQPVRVDYSMNKFKVASDEADKSGVQDSLSNFNSNISMGIRGGIPTSSSGSFPGNSQSFFGRLFDTDGFDGNMTVWDGLPFVVQRRFRSKGLRLIMEAYIQFRLLFDKPTKDPVELFAEVKDNFKALEDNTLPMEEVIKVLKNLETTKQWVALQQVKAKEEMIKSEQILIQAGFSQYQTEGSLVGFIKKCKKGLCINEIGHFTRVIPNDVIDKFEKAEALKVFDNYYILHYDPSGAANIFYEPKDPILFGVISGSDKLYFVADWIDKFCNLTYKDILQKGQDFKLTPPTAA